MTMSYIEKLLDGVEVEWKALKEVAEYSKTRISYDLLLSFPKPEEEI